MPMSPRRYQPPKSATGGPYIGASAIGRSAANAIVEKTDAVPAAISDLTKRILYSSSWHREANITSHRKLTRGRSHQMFKRRLTLIFKVDIFLTALTCRHFEAWRTCLNC